MANRRSVELLAQALKGAEAAHAKYEKNLGYPDPNWQNFYAEWILNNCDLSAISLPREVQT